MESRSLREVHVDELLEWALDAGADELHLRVGQSPYGCTAGERPITISSPYEAMSPLDLMQMVYGILSDDEIRDFQRRDSLEVAYKHGRRYVFRVSLRRTGNTIESDFARISVV